MTISELTSTLNLRHKMSLCATLACVGLIVMLGGGVRTAIGTGLLGVAFSWAFGSNHGFVHWLFVILGILLLFGAAGDAFFWSRVKPDLLKDQASLVVSGRAMQKEDLSIVLHETDKQAQRKDQEANTKDLDQLLKDEQELSRLQSEGTFRHVLNNDWGALGGGLLLLSSGLGMVIGIKPERQRECRDDS